MRNLSSLAPRYQGKRVLITGGLGFIGSNLARRLVEYGSQVTLVDSLIPEYGGNLFNIDGIAERVTVNIADVRDQYSMNYLVRNRDLMFNLAGTLSHIDSMRDPYTDLEVNCKAQLSILESCRHHNREIKIIFAGTRGQYGRAQYLPVDEKHPMQPTDVNGINNIAGEGYHLLYHQVYDIRASSLRLTNTFGQGHQMAHARQGVANYFVRQAIEGKEITVYGDGKQVRDLNYIDDVVNAFLIAGVSDEADGEVFNIGGEAVSLLQLVELITALTGGTTYRCIPYPEDAKVIEIGDYVADWSKAKRVLDWEPQTSLRQGMEKTIAYYRKNWRHYW